MDIVTMLVTMFAIALGSLALGLCILYAERTKAPWSELLVAFLSVIVGAMTLMAVEHYTNLSLANLGNQAAARIISIVFESLVSACAAFLVMFVPFFTTLIMGTLHHQRLFWSGLSVLAGAYLAAGIIRQLVPGTQWLFFLQAGIFITDYFCCMMLLWKNVGKIRDIYTRRIIVAANIVSLSLIPVFVLSTIFSDFLIASYGIYSMAFSIVMIVYFYSYFANDYKSTVREEKELMIDDLKMYHISEREFSVIKLVSEGLTNKEIATRLGISVNTVNNHVANIFSKTGVRSRIDLLNLLKETNK